MADEPDDGASVTLDADVSPWEEKLDRARTAVESWSDRVTQRFASASDAVKARTEKITGALEQIRAGAEESGDLAGSVGQVLGGLAALSDELDAVDDYAVLTVTVGDDATR